MNNMSTSQERFTFLADEDNRKELMMKDYENQFNPEWQKNNLEYDLRSSFFLCQKVRESDVYAQNLYAALCNNDFLKTGSDKKWYCSWRYAGGIVAHMKEKGDYIDWYCSGIKGELTKDEEDTLTEEEKKIYEKTKLYVAESTVTEEIKNDLKNLGWEVLTFNMTELRKEAIKNKLNKQKINGESDASTLL